MQDTQQISILIRQDWTDSNLAVLKQVLGAAYSVADLNSRVGIDERSVFSPNRKFVRGMSRWDSVNVHLADACERGLLEGITARWIPANGKKGSVQALELVGKNTTLTAHHLNELDDYPRVSQLRFCRWIENSKNQILMGSILEESAGPNSGLINVNLVHGDQDPDFAYLRVYVDPINLADCLDVSPNIMSLSSIVTLVDDEKVDETGPELRTGLGRQDEVQGQGT